MSEQGDLALGLVHLVVDLVDVVATGLENALDLEAFEGQLFIARFELGGFGHGLLVGVLGGGESLAQVGDELGEFAEPEPVGAYLEVAQGLCHLAVADGGVDLAFEGPHLALDFGDDVVEAQ